MGVFKSYFSKNNTLVKNSFTNNARNPVTELFYGSELKNVSRFIFDVNLEPLIKEINEKNITLSQIKGHYLVMVNTIAFRKDLIGTNLLRSNVDRTSGFDLDLYLINEEWNEGVGYEFYYPEDIILRKLDNNTSNWFYKDNNSLWDKEGSYLSGSTIIGSQNFKIGNEDVYINVTDIINEKITGNTNTSFGLKFSDVFENKETIKYQAVGFHTKYTNTFFEPHILTLYDNTFIDNRDSFYLDQVNQLFFHDNIGNVNVIGVKIYDYQNKLIDTFTGDTIENLGNSYKINYMVDSDVYPDMVLFKDIWEYEYNGKIKTSIQKFLLKNKENNQFNLNSNNLSINIRNLLHNEKIKNGEKRRIYLDLKSLYNEYSDFEIEYRVFVKQSGKYEYDNISWTKTSKILNTYFFDLNFTWFIPQDYYLELRVKNNGNFFKKNLIKFVVISDIFY